MRRRSLGALVAIAAGSLVIGGCGSSSSSSKRPANAIPVMVIYSKSGAIPFPHIPDGADAAIKAINAHGGVHGRPLTLLTCDDGGTASGASACGQQAIDHHILALVGSASLYGSEFLPDMVRQRIPSIGVVAGSTADFISPAVFPLVAGPPGVFAGLPYFLAKAGARKIALVRPDLAPAAGARDIGNIGLLPEHITISSEVKVPATAPDMAPYVAQAALGGTDGVVVILPGAQAVNFVSAIRQSNPNIKVAVLSTDPEALQKALGSDARGIITALDFLPGTYNAPVPREYAREMQAAGHSDLDGYQQNAWLSVHVLAQLAGRLRRVTPAALWTALIHTSDLRNGLRPPLQWTNGGVGTLPRVFSGCLLDAVFDAKGEPRPAAPRFYDAFMRKICPPV